MTRYAPRGLYLPGGIMTTPTEVIAEQLWERDRARLATRCPHIGQPQPWGDVWEPLKADYLRDAGVIAEAVRPWLGASKVARR